MPLNLIDNEWKLAFFIGSRLMIGIWKLTMSKEQKEQQEEQQKQKTEQEQTIDELQVSTDLKDNSEAALQLANDYRNEGDSCYQDGEYWAAITCYGLAIDTCPKQQPTELAIYYQKRADCYEKLENWSMVKEDCSSALQYDHRYAQAYYCRARAHEATGDLEESLIDITASCIIERSMNEDSNRCLECVLTATAHTDAEMKIRSQGPLFAKSCDIVSFMRAFAMDQSGNGSPLRGFQRAHRAFCKERFEEVIPGCTEEIESSEADYKMEALLMRGTFWLLRGASEQGKQDIDAVLENIYANVPLRASTYVWSALLQVMLNKQQEGLEILGKAEELYPENADLFYQRALILCDTKRFHEAICDFRQASRLAPRNANTELRKRFTEYCIASREKHQVRTQIAIGDLLQAIDNFPTCAEGYSMMAQVRVDQKDFGKAMKCLQKALKIQPTNATLIVQMAMLEKHWHGDLKRVFAILKEALSVDPQCYLAYRELGLVHLMQRNLEEAVNNFEKACFLARDNDEVMLSYKIRNATVAKIAAFKRLRIVKDDPLLQDDDLCPPGSRQLVFI